VLSTARLGQDHIGHELRDLAAQFASLDNDAGKLETSLESLLRAYEEYNRTATALTDWLADTEVHLEQLNQIDFLAFENLETDCKVVVSISCSTVFIVPFLIASNIILHILNIAINL